MTNRTKVILLATLVAVGLGSSAFIKNEVAVVGPTKQVVATEGKPLDKPRVEPKEKTITNITPPESRTLFLYGVVDSSVLSLRDALVRLGKDSKDPIYLLIDSPGGSVLDGAMVLSAIEASPAPVYTVCMQLCASMAAIIFEYGHKRYALDRSFVMFHPASGGSEGELDKMVSRLGSIQRYIGKMEAYIAKRANISYERYKELANVEYWIDGEDAVNLGFADSLVNVALPERKEAAAPANPENVVFPKIPFSVPVSPIKIKEFNWNVGKN